MTRGLPFGFISGRYRAMARHKNRRFRRKAFDRIGALDVGHGSAAATCEILDISDGGARLRPLMFAPASLPDNFTLVLSSCGKVRRLCRVAWRSKSELGVQFPK
jgi:PilZ domain